MDRFNGCGFSEPEGITNFETSLACLRTGMRFIRATTRALQLGVDPIFLNNNIIISK